METSPDTNADARTTIQITHGRLSDLAECKHGKDSYDKVIGRLIAYHHKTTGKVVVD